MESTAKTPGLASIDLTSVLATTINVANGSITVKNPTSSLWVAASEKKTGKMASIIYILCERFLQQSSYIHVFYYRYDAWFGKNER